MYAGYIWNQQANKETTPTPHTPSNAVPIQTYCTIRLIPRVRIGHCVAIHHQSLRKRGATPAGVGVTGLGGTDVIPKLDGITGPNWFATAHQPPLT